MEDKTIKMERMNYSYEHTIYSKLIHHDNIDVNQRSVLHPNQNKKHFDLETLRSVILADRSSSSNYPLGVFYVIVTCTCYWIGNLILKLLYKSVSNTTSIELLLTRNIYGLLGFIFLSYQSDINFRDFKGLQYLVMAWALATLGCHLWFVNAMKYIPATKVQLIADWHPVLGITIAYLILKENVSNIDKISVAISIIGIVLIVQHNTDFASDLQNPVLGYFLSAGQLVLNAFAYIGLRVINQKLSCMIVPFYYCIMAIWLFIVLYLFDHSLIDYSKFSFLDHILLSGFALFSIGGQVFTNVAFRYAQASELAPLWNFIIIISFAVDWFVLGYDFNITDYLGTFIMLFAFLMPIVFRKWD